jgi:hypothetical protein
MNASQRTPPNGPEHNRRGNSRQGEVLGADGRHHASNVSPLSYDDDRAAASDLVVTSLIPAPRA